MIILLLFLALVYILTKDVTISSCELDDMEKDQDENPENWT